MEIDRNHKLKHMRNALIEVIPHRLQRYDTAGDWYHLSNGMNHFKISEMSNPIYEHALSIHEQIEEFWCQMNGVTQEMVDAWDFSHEDYPDPGALPDCPYYPGHIWAQNIEKRLIWFYGLDWEEYDKSFDSLEELWRESITGEQ